MVFAPFSVRAAEPQFTGPFYDPSAVMDEALEALLHSSLRPDPRALAEAAIRGMVASLDDPYAEYLTRGNMMAFLTNVEGTFGGIGVMLDEDAEGCLIVRTVMPGCPGERAGLVSGDRIVAVDGQDIAGRGLEAAALIRGVPGTSVLLTVARAGVVEPLPITVVRETIQAPSVDFRMVEDGVGFLKIVSFDNDTNLEVDYALQWLVSEGARAIIIDLRGNPGGLVSTCQRVAERFIPQKYPIMRTRWSWQSEIVRSRVGEGYESLEGIDYGPNGRFPHPVAVLVDGYTASAAEILTVSLQEWGVARVFGQRTFGKGCFQNLFPLSNGGGVKLTTAVWTSGLNRRVDGVGIVPDELVVGEITSAGVEQFTPMPDEWVFERGDHGSDVVVLQQRLNQLGYDSGPEDGLFGLKTEKALKSFQAAVGLAESGRTDRATVDALNRARIADHPAGAHLPGPQPVRPAAAPPTVTGDPAVDRAIQWLQGS